MPHTYFNLILREVFGTKFIQARGKIPIIVTIIWPSGAFWNFTSMCLLGTAQKNKT